MSHAPYGCSTNESALRQLKPYMSHAVITCRKDNIIIYVILQKPFIFKGRATKPVGK